MMPVYVGGNYGQFELISNAVSNALFIRFTDWPNLLIPSCAKGQFPYPICHIPVTDLLIDQEEILGPFPRYSKQV